MLSLQKRLRTSSKWSTHCVESYACVITLLSRARCSSSREQSSKIKDWQSSSTSSSQVPGPEKQNGANWKYMVIPKQKINTKNNRLSTKNYKAVPKTRGYRILDILPKYGLAYTKSMSPTKKHKLYQNLDCFPKYGCYDHPLIFSLM